MTWYGGSLRPGDIVLDGDPAPPSLKGHSPQFSAHVCCGQTAGWIKMPLGIVVGLSSSYIVLDGEPGLPKGAHPLLLRHGQTAGWIKMLLGTEISLGPGHIVLDRNRAPQKGEGHSNSPFVGPCMLWPNGWMDQGTETGLGPGDIVLDGDPAHPPPEGQSLQFSAHIYCGHMAGWIKMPLGREVGLGPSNTVLDGDPAPSSSTRGQSPQFLANGWMDQDATWYGGWPWPRRRRVRWGPSSP